MATQCNGVAPSVGEPQIVKTPESGYYTSGAASNDASVKFTDGLDGAVLGAQLAGAPGAVIGYGLDMGATYLMNKQQAKLSDEYAQKAEARADARTRALIRDQPSLTAEGRRQAGLNPYGDATIPGVQGQSSIDTKADTSMLGRSSQSYATLVGTQLQQQQVANETLLAESQANRNNAEAERLRGQEGRDTEGWSHQLQLLIGKVNNQELKNSLLEFDKELREYTIENEKALSDVELEYAFGRLDEQSANILLSNATADEKRATIEYINEQKLYLSLQRAVYEVTGLELAYADVERAWSEIANLDQDTALKTAQTDVERAAINEVYARIDQINAEIKEIPKNARAARWRGRFQSITDLSEQALNWVGAIATGGVSAGVRSAIGSSHSSGYNRPSSVTVSKGFRR